MIPSLTTRNQTRQSPGLRILIVRIGAMGDVLHGLPAVAALRRALPDCTIGWAVEPHWAPLLIGTDGPGPIVDQVHLVSAREWQRRPLAFVTGGELSALRRDLRAANYDLCIDLQGSIKSAAVARLAATRRLVGPDQPREGPARLLYNQHVQCSRQHVVQQAAELVGAAIGQPLEPAPVLLPVDADAEGWCNGALIRASIGERFVLLAPGAGWGAKQWGATRYRQLAARLRESGFGVVVNAPATGPEAELADAVAEAGGGQKLSSTIPQLITLTRRADLIIGGDTGPVHLAAALGRPVVALFGPTDPSRNGPFFPGSQTRVLRHPDSHTSHKRVAETDAGLANITVDEVDAAACAMLGASLDVTHA